MNNEKWIEAKELYGDGIGVTQISRDLDIPLSTLKLKIKKEEWSRDTHQEEQPPHEHDFKKMQYEEGFSVADILLEKYDTTEDEATLSQIQKADAIAVGLGKKRKVSIKISGGHKTATISTIEPTESQRTYARALLDGYSTWKGKIIPH